MTDAAPSPDAATDGPTVRRAVLGLVLLATSLFLVRLDEGGLADDPVLYAAVAKSINHTGDFLTMHVGTTPYFNKPPLQFWMTALLFRLVGPTVWAARLPGALMGVATILLLFDLTRRCAGTRVGLLAGLVLCLSNDFLRFSVMGRLDTPQVFWMTAAAWCFTRVVTGDPAWRLLGAGVCAGLGVLTKSPLPLLLVVPLVVAAWRAGRTAPLRSVRLWGGVLLGLAPMAAWIFLVTKANPDFPDRFLGQQMVDRITGEGYSSSSKLGSLRTLCEHFLPWTLLVPVGLWRQWRRRPDGDDTSERVFLRWLVLLWLLIIGAAALSPSRLYDRYHLPLYPALAVMAAFGLERILSAKRIDATGRYLPAAGTALGLIIFLAPVRRHSEKYGSEMRAVAPVVEARLPGDAPLAGFGIGKGGHKALEQAEAAVFFYLDRELVRLDAAEARDRRPEVVLAGSAGFEETLVPLGYIAAVRIEDIVLAVREERGAAVPGL